MLETLTRIAPKADARPAARPGLAALFLGLVFVLALAVAPARAAVILNIDGSGQLTGAQNVDVNGTLYDVTFQDGTCIALFNGCDNAATDFTFTDMASAQAAATALMNTVFLDGPSGNFDTNPSLTFGCGSDPKVSCQILIPYEIVPPIALPGSPGVQGYSFLNGAVSDSLASYSVLTSFDSSNLFVFGEAVYALFTPAGSGGNTGGGTTTVPEPASALLFGIGLAGLAAVRRRHRKGSANGPLGRI